MLYKTIHVLALIACLGVGHALPRTEGPSGVVIAKADADTMYGNSDDKVKATQKTQVKITRPVSAGWYKCSSCDSGRTGWQFWDLSGSSHPGDKYADGANDEVKCSAGCTKNSAWCDAYLMDPDGTCLLYQIPEDHAIAASCSSDLYWGSVLQTSITSKRLQVSTPPAASCGSSQEPPIECSADDNAAFSQISGMSCPEVKGKFDWFCDACQHDGSLEATSCKVSCAACLGKTVNECDDNAAFLQKARMSCAEAREKHAAHFCGGCQNVGSLEATSCKASCSAMKESGDCLVPDRSKCLEKGSDWPFQKDNDCCARPEWADCADGLTSLSLIPNITCGGNGAKVNLCFPSSVRSDPSKCLERGEPDSDCCARDGTAGCAPGATLFGGDKCGGRSHRTYCIVDDAPPPKIGGPFGGFKRTGHYCEGYKVYKRFPTSDAKECYNYCKGECAAFAVGPKGSPEKKPCVTYDICEDSGKDNPWHYVYYVKE